MDMSVATLTDFAAIPTQVIGIGDSGRIARALVANTHPHTAPTSHV